MEPAEPVRRRVFVPHALGADEFLRVTWHDARRVAVFSVWSGSECTAAVPVRGSGLDDVAAPLDQAVATGDDHRWPAPDAGAMIGPAAGFRVARVGTGERDSECCVAGASAVHGEMM